MVVNHYLMKMPKPAIIANRVPGGEKTKAPRVIGMPLIICIYLVNPSTC
jgi:hypothetical protein